MGKILTIPTSGSCANVVYSHNRYGQYTRNRTTPANPQTTRQMQVRQGMTACTQQWKELSQTQRDAWQSYAQEYPRTGSLGTRHKMDGFHAFVSNSLNLNTLSITVTGSLPTSRQIQYPGTTTVTGDSVGETIPVTWANTTSSTDYLTVAASPPMSTGRSFNAVYTLFGVATLSDGTIDIGNAYASQYSHWEGGQKTFVKITPINGSGIAGPSTTLTFIAT